MNKKGPIILIDDDQDDLQLLIEVFADFNLPNEVHLFKNTDSVLNFLRKPGIDPFLIISDINMPVVNGFRLREIVLSDEKINCAGVPYIFFTTSSMLKFPDHVYRSRLHLCARLRRRWSDMIWH